MNTVSLVGKLTRDPTTKFDGDSLQVTSFSLATSEPGKDGRVFTLYVPCQAYGRTAETCSLLNAEDMVAVSGKLSWQKRRGKCGEEHASMLVNVRECQVLQPAEVTV